MRRGRALAPRRCAAATPSSSIASMYLSFFGLNEKPFAITPDPRYLYLSERHAEALAHLLYGINEAGGFVQLTGEVGTGKTTIVRSLLAQTPKNAEIALILNPKMTRGGVPADHLRGARDRGARLRARQPEGPGRHPQPLPAARARRRAARGAGGGRGAEPLPRGARAGAPAHQPRNQHAEAAADHPHRPAGTARAARPQRAAPAGPARHRALPPEPAVARGDHRLRAPPPARGRFHHRHLRPRGAQRGVPPLRGRAARDQRHQRPGAARVPTRSTATA